MQALAQLGVVSVKTQPDDVHRLAGKGDRDFSARQVMHALRLGRGSRALLAADFVMVRQRPQLHAVGMGALGQRFRGQGAV